MNYIGTELMYNFITEDEFLYKIRGIYLELEDDTDDKDYNIYPYTLWLYDLYELIEEHKEELKR